MGVTIVGETPYPVPASDNGRSRDIAALN